MHTCKISLSGAVENEWPAEEMSEPGRKPILYFEQSRCREGPAATRVTFSNQNREMSLSERQQEPQPSLGTGVSEELINKIKIVSDIG